MKANTQYAESYGYLRVIEGGLSIKNEVYEEYPDETTNTSSFGILWKAITILLKCIFTVIWTVMLFTGGSIGLIAVAIGVIFLVVTSLF